MYKIEQIVERMKELRNDYQMGSGEHDLLTSLLAECETGIPIIGSNLFLSPDDENLIKVIEKHGKTHKIEAISGTDIDLTLLRDNQSCCWGDGEFYHFILTKHSLSSSTLFDKIEPN